MYQIYCDSNLIYDVRYKEFVVLDAILNLEVSKAATLTFTIYPDHPYYDRLKKLESIIKVLKNQKVIFIGRIISDEQGLYNQKLIECESVFAFLNDSIYQPFEFSGTPSNLFGSIIDNHNLQVVEKQKIKVGNVTVTSPDDNITESSDDYLSSYELLKTKLLDKLEGYTIERYVNESVYLDYLSTASKIATQKVCFGENLIDILSKNDATETYSVVIPLGYQVEEEVDEEGNVIKESHRLTIESVNNDKYYIVNQDALNKYGWIVAPTDETTWDDITTPSELYDLGLEYLNNQAIMMKNTVELTAIDLSIINIDIESFSLGQSIRLYSKPHNFDKEYLLKQMTIPLDNPQNLTISLGETIDTLTGINLGNKQKVDETIEKVEIINSDYVKNAQLTTLKDETLKTVTSIIQDSEKISFEAMESLESNLQNQINNIETLKVSLDVNLPTTQVYDYDTNLYTPNYINQNLNITPNVKLGNTSVNLDKCNFQWYKNNVLTSTNAIFIIKENLTEQTNLYKCVVTYSYMKDSKTITYSDEVVININLIKNGKKGETGTIGADGVGVSNITKYYLATTLNSGITTSTNGWTTTVQTMTTTKKYLWSYETYVYTDDSIVKTTPCIIGTYGDTGNTGIGISSIINYYLASSSSSGVTTSTSGWTTTVQTMVTTKKYLWSYEEYVYTDNSIVKTTPYIIGVYGDTGNTGVGISGVINYYLASASSSGVTTSTSGWTTSIQTISTSKKYLWNYEIIKYTNDSATTTIPTIIGVYGDTGATGATGKDGSNAYNVIIAPNSTQFISENGGTSYTPASINLTPTFQNCNYNVWQYSTNGSTWINVVSGSNGLTISNKVLTITASSTLFDTNKSISFRAVSDVTNVAATITITKQEIVNDLTDKLENLQDNIDIANVSVSDVSASLTLLKDSLTSKISESWNLEYGKEYNALIEQVSNVVQTINDWGVEFNSYKEVVNALGASVTSEVSKYMRFNSSGQLIIGSTDSKYQVAIDNDSFDILYGGNIVATFSENMLITKNASISNGLQIGNVVINSYTNGVTFKWGGS